MDSYAWTHQKSHIYQVCADTGCSLEVVLGTLVDSDKWRERVKRLFAISMLIIMMMMMMMIENTKIFFDIKFPEKCQQDVKPNNKPSIYIRGAFNKFSDICTGI